VRIVHLVIGGDVAGGQLVALQVMRAARERGDHIAVVSPSEGPFVDLVRADGVTVHIADVNRTFRLGDLLRLVRILRAERADVLHTHTAVAANILTRIAGKLADTKVVTHVHMVNYFRPQRLPALVLRTLDTLTARLAARIVTVSEATRATLVAQGYPPARVEVIPNGVDVDGVAATRGGELGLRSELGVPAGVPLVGEVGRLCAMKGQRELIEAIALVPGAWVVLVGADIEQGGRYEAELRTAASEAGVADRVVFAGFRPDASDLIGAFDVLALPSWTEGMPLVTLEAMARGVPVVATAVGGIPEVVVDGTTGLLVPLRDPQALAAALRALTDDPARARVMGEAGRARVHERFRAADSIARTLEVYDELAR
jgi:glycosyltransferase involved in cell wall biosynthesis